VVAGLGNPGGQYEGTRHNVGFDTVDVLAARKGSDIRRREFLALTARVELGRSMVLLMKPQTFMNASGRAVAALLEDLGLTPGSLIAVHDDLDLDLGRIRVRPEGGSGGHRGIASIAEEIGTSAFVRVRVGIGRPPAGCEVIDHVLSPFTEDEKQAARDAIALAADAVETIVDRGVTAAMQAFNGARPELAGA
jgi:PTH1 family peptidyl-tRNA hydrolase